MNLNFIEAMEYEVNARYDYLSEAFGPTAKDAAMFAEAEDFNAFAMAEMESLEDFDKFRDPEAANDWDYYNS